MDANELYDPEFRKLIKSKQTVIIPVGSLEQHGAHLPITTDSDIVTEIASRLGKKCGFIVFPTIGYGLSDEHSPLFNTTILDPNLFVDYLSNIIVSLKQHIKNISIIILNGHHGNSITLEEYFDLYNNPGPASMEEYEEYLKDTGSDPLAGYTFEWFKAVRDKRTANPFKLFHYWHFMEHEFDHAGFVETSIMLAISDKVKMKKAKKGLITKGLSEKEIQRIKKLSTQPGGFPKVAKNGVWVDPTKATTKDGEKFLAEIVRNLAKECQS